MLYACFQIGDNTCSETHRQAARNKCSSVSSQAETGLCLAACRHAVVLKAINMFQGEIFAYPLFVIQAIAKDNSIGFVCQDVICRFWPWLQKIQQEKPQTILPALKDMKPFLSVMHAKAHDWACQVNV